MRRIVIVAVFLLLSAAVAWAQSSVVVHLEGDVQPISAEYVVRGLHYAAAHKAEFVLLTLSTPGGLDSSMRSIIQAILASPLPVVCFVEPSGARSASAGFFILESCDVSAMAPGTNTGAAHPVVLGGSVGKRMMEKIQNDAAAYMRSIAGHRGRNASLAESAVLQSKSFTDEEALRGHLIELVAADVPALLHDLDGRTITRWNGDRQTLRTSELATVDFPMTLRERILDMDPNVAFLLLVLGALGIYVEFTHPGFVLPGAAGVVAVVIALFAMSVLPINWAAAGLLILAFALFAVEAKFPSHGVLAIAGITALVFGALFLVDSPEPAMRIRLSVALAVAVPFGVAIIILLRLVWAARRWKVAVGQEALIGESGIARSPIAPMGTIFVNGQLWQAHSSVMISTGAPVRVKSVRGLLLEVEPAGAAPGHEGEATSCPS
jgi:membrane-bound serine protease (ClpP class)